MGFSLIEVLVAGSETSLPKIFEDIGITKADFHGAYSWNSGTGTVPTYDS